MQVQVLASASESGREILDVEKAVQQFHGKMPLFLKVLQVYLKRSTALITEAHSLLERGDVQAVLTKLTHLCSDTAIICATPFLESCEHTRAVVQQEMVTSASLPLMCCLSQYAFYSRLFSLFCSYSIFVH